MMKKAGALVLTLALILSLCGCKSKLKAKSQTGVYFDTVVTLITYNEDAPKECFTLCEKYDKLFSATDKSSDIYKLNHAAGKPVTVDSETAAVIKTALGYCKASDGALDITLRAVSELWDFKAENPKLPQKDALKSALSTVGYKKVQLSGNTVTLPKGTKLDLGCIAKGYVADRIKEIYEKHRLSGIINLGGNVLTVGKKPDETPFSVGIKEPFSENDYVATLRISGGSVVTSGVYERCFELDGQRYHHLLDAKTGYPVENGLDSVTVLAESSAEADALSTALFCMGKAAALDYVNGKKGVYAVFLGTDASLTVSEGLTLNDGVITVDES